MMKTPKLTIGTEIEYEATSYVVEGFAGSVVVMRSTQGEVIRMGLRHLVLSTSFKIIGRLDDEVKPVFLEGVSQAEQRALNELVGHLQHALRHMTGLIWTLTQGGTFTSRTISDS